MELWYDFRPNNTNLSFHPFGVNIKSRLELAYFAKSLSGLSQMPVKIDFDSDLFFGNGKEFCWIGSETGRLIGSPLMDTNHRYDECFDGAINAIHVQGSLRIKIFSYVGTRKWKCILSDLFMKNHRRLVRSLRTQYTSTESKTFFRIKRPQIVKVVKNYLALKTMFSTSTRKS